MSRASQKKRYYLRYPEKLKAKRVRHYMRYGDRIRGENLERQREIRELINAYKLKGCGICGYSKCVDALCFHHILGKENKNTEINKLRVKSSWRRVQREIEKCILVCSNCHAEIHAKERLEKSLTTQETMKSPNIIQLSMWEQ